MRINKSKVAIIGSGLVGSSTAFSIITQGVCDEVLMVDINAEKASGEVRDLRNSIRFLDRNVRVKAGSYADCSDADIVVITAGAPPKAGQTRLDTLDISAKIAKSIVEPVMESGFDGIFVVVSNPVDMLAHLVYKLSGLPKNQVIGSGTSVDSARLQNFLADMVDVDPRSVYAYALGEHGDSLMVPWSTVTIAGKSFTDIIADNAELVGDVDLDEIVYKTTQEGWEIYNRKGTTYYGIASACVGIIKAVLYDENSIVPVSTLLEGEYGETGIFAGVPAVLNRSGVFDILEIHMTDSEEEKFHHSADIIREYTAKIQKYADEK
ncbi:MULTISPECIES: L-lactate dehydrogenase [Enterococcus]|uniref:L-lactate dehydrogenase n=1 Tax=Enterococcus dispar ATCC 51266 TaxID=1139219 RepID=S1N7J3_9ENTE|nr:L-lactate dehydrogenase [Enterococcus dispar]EOT42552.1 L-lactate dehydrogenase [Enterococcus dispar ATCC 51266]EOW84997.1 L-lactate dehydrogenase [Enterococcus dispar ATCC 51266]MCU7356095.1 L-lactate dehydrogenase [Enterococcus dispar]MDT2704853.1 L-lactate dehydrogenase [Enterococcus dispar]WCG33438.1 L-lactate dehydrogenase [Enterococcus dispar]